MFSYWNKGMTKAFEAMLERKPNRAVSWEGAGR